LFAIGLNITIFSLHSDRHEDYDDSTDEEDEKEDDENGYEGFDSDLNFSITSRIVIFIRRSLKRLSRKMERHGTFANPID
jgi:hypothetical protein